MPFKVFVGGICVVLANLVAILALKDAWFGKDVKSGIAPFFGLFIVGPLAIVGLWILCPTVSWHLAWTLVPAYVMIYEGLRKLF